jgi:hypothetical protein
MFIYYSEAPDQALDAFEMVGAKPMLGILAPMFNLLSMLRLAIPNSIMVSTGWPISANITNSS